MNKKWFTYQFLCFKSCFNKCAVNFIVNNLYRRQYALEGVKGEEYGSKFVTVSDISVKTNLKAFFSLLIFLIKKLIFLIFYNNFLKYFDDCIWVISTGGKFIVVELPQIFNFCLIPSSLIKIETSQIMIGS